MSGRYLSKKSTAFNAYSIGLACLWNCLIPFSKKFVILKIDKKIAVPAEREVAMVSFAEKVRKRIAKRESLENGKRQFCTMPELENRTYVWVGNVSLPVSR